MIESYLISVALCCAAYVAWQFVKKRRLAAVYDQAVPSHWPEIFARNVPLYDLMPSEYKRRLHGHVHYLLSSTEFVACEGMELTEEMRLAIAGTACLLLASRDDRAYPELKTILLYPSAYYAGGESHQEVRQGESWFRGPVVLSWQDADRGNRHPRDGHNVILHEFAHKLDEEDGVMNGVPLLREREHYAQWSEVLNDEYSAFERRVARGKAKLIDEYGLLSPVEFFAVVTEVFFEKPQQLKKKLPNLYAQMERYFAMDPASWLKP